MASVSTPFMLQLSQGIAKKIVILNEAILNCCQLHQLSLGFPHTYFNQMSFSLSKQQHGKAKRRVKGRGFHIYGLHRSEEAEDIY